MSLRPPTPEILRRWLVPAALFAVTPKCVLCLLAYAGMGTALGMAGPELCGSATGPAAHGPAWLAAFGILSCIGCLARRRRQARP